MNNHRLSGEENDGVFCLLMATYHKSKGEDALALSCYEQAAEKLTDNDSALRGVARMAFVTKNYSRAEEAYDILCAKHPDNLALAQNRVLSKIYAGKAKEIVNEVYRLDFERENDIKTKRLLAWVLFCNKRLIEVESLYGRILAGEYGEPSTEDHLSYAELLWLLGRQQQAVDVVAAILKEDSDGEKEKSCIASMENDFELLSVYFKTSAQDAFLIVDAAVLL